MLMVLALAAPLMTAATWGSITPSEKPLYGTDNCTPCLYLTDKIECDHLCMHEGGSTCCCWDMPEMSGGTVSITPAQSGAGTLNAAKDCIKLSPTTTTDYSFVHTDAAGATSTWNRTIFVVPPLEINNFIATPQNGPDSCKPGGKWKLSWDVPNTVPVDWIPVNVTISLLCNGVLLYNLGSYPPDNYSTTITLPQDFDPTVSKNCQFCLTASNCASCTGGMSSGELGDKVTKCVPMVCDNVTCTPCTNLNLGVNKPIECDHLCIHAGGSSCCCWDMPDMTGGTMWITSNNMTFGTTLSASKGCVTLSPTTTTAYAFHYLNQAKTSGTEYPVTIYVVPPLEIKSFEAVPPPNDPDPCEPGKIWTLSWNVPNTVPVDWTPVDVTIGIVCNGIPMYFLGSYPPDNYSTTITIPQGFNPAVSKNCQFCLTASNCASCTPGASQSNLGDKVTKCVPMVCDNCTPCQFPACKCLSYNEANSLGYLLPNSSASTWPEGAILCHPFPCDYDEQNQAKYCVSPCLPCSDNQTIDHCFIDRTCIHPGGSARACWNCPHYCGENTKITITPAVPGMDTLNPAKDCIELTPTETTEYTFVWEKNPCPTADAPTTGIGLEMKSTIFVIPEPKIDLFKATPADPLNQCNPGENWTLDWEVSPPLTTGSAQDYPSFWVEPPTPIIWSADNSTIISLRCTDSLGNTAPAWGPTRVGVTGPATLTLPADFNPSGKNCEFCITHYTCAGDNVTQCIPIVCDNCSSFKAKVEHSEIHICEGDTIRLNGSVENPVPSATYNYTWISPNPNFINPVYSGPYEPVDIFDADLNDSGLYTLTVTYGKCSDNATVMVTVCEGPVASITVDKTSNCPMLFTLTGKPDGMQYGWTDSKGQFISDEQKLKINTTSWPEGDYTYTLTVKDSSCCKKGCTDNATAILPVHYAKCSGNCTCEPAPIVIMGCKPPVPCDDDPCGCDNLTAYFPNWYWVKYCYPKTNPPHPTPPCPSPEITSFTATGVISPVSPCIGGQGWNLNWHVDVPDPQNVTWPAPGDSTHPVYIALRCTDAGNNVETYWGPQAFEPDGSYICSLPQNFSPTGKKCEFCLWTYDCHGNQVMECRPMCPNTSVSTSTCPQNCECMTEKEALDKSYTTICSDKPCSAPGEPRQYCYSRCPEGCSCLTEKEANELGYVISCGDEKCDPTSKEAKYCFSPPLQPCSQNCQCLTQAQAKEFGYSDSQRCQTTPCKQDAQGKDMYCYPKPKAPVVDVTADRSFVTAGDKVKVCWAATGEGITEVLFSAAGEKPEPVERQGCRTFVPSQQTRYLVTAKSAAGSGQDAVTVGVGQPPVEEEVCPTINSFTVNCPRTPGGQGEAIPLYVPPCSVCWSVTGPDGTAVSLSCCGAVGMSGTTQVQRGATITLTARYRDCVRTATVQVPR